MLTATQALVLTALLTWLMIVTASNLRARMWTLRGLKYGFGNRDTTPEVSPVAGRAERAARNMLESLPLFFAVMLAAQLSGAQASRVALGASVFFWARVVYWPIYLVGIPYARTLAWAVSLVGVVTIGVAALSGGG